MVRHASFEQVSRWSSDDNHGRSHQHSDHADDALGVHPDHADDALGVEADTDPARAGDAGDALPAGAGGVARDSCDSPGGGASESQLSHRSATRQHITCFILIGFFG